MSTATLPRPTATEAPARVLRVGMDLDGVNMWFDRTWYAGCITAGLLPPGTAYQTSTCWNFYELYDLTLEEFLASCNQLADLGLLWCGDPIPGSATMWDAILDDGHELHVVTDRAFGTHPAVSEVATRIWLAQHGRRYTSLTFTRDKTSVLTDIMLEDKLENYDALDGAGCRGVLINRPWNAPYDDGRRRVVTHDGFLALVRAMAAEVSDDA